MTFLKTLLAVFIIGVIILAIASAIQVTKDIEGGVFIWVGLILLTLILRKVTT